MEKGQMRAPVYEALEKLKKRRVVPFDVPGHKRGRGNPELVELLGEKCVSLDVNSMKPLDNLCHPVSVIKEAEELAAEAFRADHAFFMVGGTTSSVQGMVLSVCKAGDEIILPRNVHKSVINALVLCGAIPVYVNPEMDNRLGISLGMQVSEVEKAILEHPKAVAVLVNNPTYYGICSDLRSIVKVAHAHGMKVLVDEAHGTHLYFGENLPVCAMDAGADMASVSMHKSGGSLTQSSLLLTGKNVNWEYVSQIINLTQTTSASYLLMSKLSVYTRDIGLAGIEVYDLLRDEYDIQIELGDIANILAYISIGDRIQDIERLVGALADIKRLYSKDPASMLNTEYINPKVLVSPQTAFYSEKTRLPIRETSGRICAEFVMCYPPGIPILAPGELITDEIIEYVLYAKEKGCSMQGTEDPAVEYLNVL